MGARWNIVYDHDHDHMLVGVIVTILVAWVIQWTYRWRNPKCSTNGGGRLPPGSMGFPLLGESIHFFARSNSLDMPKFLRIRAQKYGPLFKTSLAGRPVVVSLEPEFSHHILQREGKLVDLWYMDGLTELVDQGGSLKSGARVGSIHTHLKKLILKHVGLERLQGGRFLLQLQDQLALAFQAWTTQESVAFRPASSKVITDFSSKMFFGVEPTAFGEDIYTRLKSFWHVLLSFPLFVPGTTFYKCIQDKKKIMKAIKGVIKERQLAFGSDTDNNKRSSNLLDQLVDGMDKESFMSSDLVAYLVFSFLIAPLEALPSTLTFLIKCVTENPLVLQELEKENEQFLKNRQDASDNQYSWKDYKSLTFTNYVINESLRLVGSIGMFRKALTDIHYKGYTIPKDWIIIVYPYPLHLNPKVYEDPLSFNPWRWKNMEASSSSDSFMPFGWGSRSCVGSDFSRVFMTIFLHVLVTRYRWTKVKGGDFIRSPLSLDIEDGFYIKVSEKSRN